MQLNYPNSLLWRQKFPSPSLFPHSSSVHPRPTPETPPSPPWWALCPVCWGTGGHSAALGCRISSTCDNPAPWWGNIRLLAPQHSSHLMQEQALAMNVTSKFQFPQTEIQKCFQVPNRPGSDCSACKVLSPAGRAKGVFLLENCWWHEPVWK